MSEKSTSSAGAAWALAAAGWFLAVGILFLGWKYLEKRFPEESASTPEVVAEQASPMIGEEVVCPVTGEIVVVDADTPTVDYRGRTYYFSSRPDEAGKSPKFKFLMNPELYVDGISVSP